MVKAFPEQLRPLEFSVLPSFSEFVERNHIEEFTAMKIAMSETYKLPFLEYLADHTEEQVKQIFFSRAKELLGALSDNKGGEYIQEKKDQWLNDQLHNTLKKTDLHLADVILWAYIRKKLLLSFAPAFTKDVAQYHILNEEIETFFVRYNLVFSEAFLLLMNEEKEQRSQVEEREQRLKVAMETTGLGVCDYDLVTGKILASESCRTVFGWGKDKVVTFDDFMSRIDESERDNVAKGITEAVLGEQKLFEAEFPIIREDGETRWLKAQGKVLTDDTQTPVRMIGTILDITEAKSSERQLVASEQQFRQLADSMPQLIWEAAKDGRITYLNKKWLEYTGLTEVQTGNWQSIHPDDIPVSQLFWEVSVETGTVYEAELRIRSRYGDYKWFLVRALPVRDDADNITKWYGTCTDIHEQKLIDESLQLQARVLESMEEGVVITDENGLIRYTNKAEDTLFGYEEDELIGEHLTILNAYPEDENKQKVHDVYAQLNRNGFWDGEWQNRRKDGTIFYTSSHITTLSLGDEKFFVSVQRDITEEKRARQVLAESEGRFRALADEAPMFVWMADEKANITYCNKEFLGYTGHDDYSYVTGRIWETVTHPEDLMQIFAVYVSSMQNPHPFSADARFKNAAGEYRWFRFRGVPRKQNGVLKGFIGTAIDIHEEKMFTQELERRVQERTEALVAANAQLERSNDELEQFAYVASHDLHEPLRKIQSFADLLTEKHNSMLSEEGTMLIDKIQLAATRMRVLIDDLLSFSRVSHNDDQKEIVDLNGLLKEVLGDLETALNGKKATVHAGELEPVNGNQLQLRQLFKNILGNSLKFTRDGLPAVISITSEKITGKASGRTLRAEDADREFQLITVQDNGLGFEPQYADRIFELFNKRHGKASYTLTGIGLSVAKKAVEKHNGYIWAESMPGEGTTFHILLPYLPEPAR